MAKKYYEELINAIGISPSSNKLIEKLKKMLTKNFIIFSVIGIVCVYIFFHLINFFFKLPFIIIFGVLIGYILNILYAKYSQFKKLRSFSDSFTNSLLTKFK